MELYSYYQLDAFVQNLCHLTQWLYVALIYQYQLSSVSLINVAVHYHCSLTCYKNVILLHYWLTNHSWCTIPLLPDLLSNFAVLYTYNTTVDWLTEQCCFAFPLWPDLLTNMTWLSSVDVVYYLAWLTEHLLSLAWATAVVSLLLPPPDPYFICIPVPKIIWRIPEASTSFSFW